MAAPLICRRRTAVGDAYCFAARRLVCDGITVSKQHDCRLGLLAVFLRGRSLFHQPSVSQRQGGRDLRTN